MTLKYDDLIARYFEHRMTPKEEQNFLISLAASDEMRLQFRSHLELMKAVRQDKDDMRPVAHVRARTLTALGLSTAVVSQFLEHGIINSDKAPAEAPQPVQSAGIGAKGKFGGLRSIFRNGLITLSSGLIIGFAGALAYFGSNNPSTVHPQVTTPQVVAPSVTQPSSREPLQQEQLQVNSKQEAGSQSVLNENSVSEKHTQAAKIRTSPQETPKSISEPTTSGSTLINKQPESNLENPVEIRKSGQGTMRSKVQINKPVDSSRKE